MKTNSFNGKRSQDKGSINSSILITKTINKIARKCQYLKRSSGKIIPKNLIVGFMIMVSRKRNTYADWAKEIGILEGQTITRQAINERMNPQTECFLKEFIEQQLSQKMKSYPTQKLNGILKNFKSIKIDDSTILSLPDELADTFPGNVTGGIKKSQAKIHAMYNLTKNNFSFLNVYSFSNNDQSLSQKVLPYLQAGDLCIRDLGFSTLASIEKFNQRGIYFIARKSYSNKIYNIDTEKEIDILKEIGKNLFLDKDVLLGKQKIKARIVVVKLPQEQANQRKRKAKMDRDRRLNHAPKYYKLLSYGIYISNISSEKCNVNQIAELYRLRWRIEIIFKSWKSCFSIEKILHNQCKNIIRVNCIIYLMLLYIYLFHVIWWQNLKKKMRLHDKHVQLSILKLSRFFQQHFFQIIYTELNETIIKQIRSHCTYDKRNDRKNAVDYYHGMAA